MKNKTKYTGLICGIAVASIVGYGFKEMMISLGDTADTAEASGIVYSERSSESDSDEYDVSKIGVVNLDEGIKQNDKEVFYAKHLLNISNSSDFEYCSLSEAQTGISNGTYGAYIVIPTDFSENVVSVNDIPVVSKIEYVISDRVIDKCKYESLLKITNLSNELNNDLSYMYLESLLADVHEVQDHAQEVMDNDLSDKDIIDKIKSADLISLVEFPEMKTVDNDTKSVDSSAYNSDNEQQIKGLNNEYSLVTNEAANQRSNITKQKEELEKALTKSQSQTVDIDIFTDEKGRDLKKKAQADVDTKVDSFNKEINSRQTEIEKRAEAIYQDASSVTSIVNEEVNSAKEKLNVSNKAIEDIKDNIPSLEIKNKSEEDGSECLYLTYDDNKIKESRKKYDYKSECNTEDKIPSKLIAKKKPRKDQNALILKGVISNIDSYISAMNNCATPSDPGKLSMDGLFSYCVEKGVFSDIDSDLQDINKSRIYEALNATDLGCYEEWKLEPDSELTDMKTMNDFVSKEINNYVSNSQVDNSIFEKTTANINTINNNLVNLDKTAKAGFESLDTEEMNQLLDKGYFSKIKDNEKNIKKKYNNIYSSATSDIDKFSQLLGATDFSIDTSFSSEYISKISENNNNLVADALESNGSYMEYASNVEKANSDNIEAIRTNIQNANDTAQKTVEDGLNEAKKIKTTNSAENQLVLDEITKKLQYTRIGSLENQNVYEFMANPVDLSGDQIVDKGTADFSKNTDISDDSKQMNKDDNIKKSDSVNETVVQSNSTKNATTIFVCIVLGVIVLAAVILAIMKYLGKNKNKWD